MLDLVTLIENVTFNQPFNQSSTLKNSIKVLHQIRSKYTNTWIIGYTDSEYINGNITSQICFLL